MSKDTVATTSSERTPLSRRSFLKSLAAVMGLAATSALPRTSDGPGFRGKTDTTAQSFVAVEDSGSQEVMGNRIENITHAGRLLQNEHCIRVSTEKLFLDVGQIPGATDPFPALVMYNNKHQEKKKSLRDLFLFADRVMVVFTKNPNIVPVVSSPFQPPQDQKQETQVFFPLLSDVNAGSKSSQLQKHAPFLVLSPALVSAIDSGAVQVHWRNFGSGFRRGILPNIQLIRTGELAQSPQ